ncbi:MAG: hypothetical protein M1833_006619 [Piccolia ochrophora]|nr:MAG: hypothetical protein M1833_006619 [Piccolia ochrophora]
MLANDSPPRSGTTPNGSPGAHAAIPRRRSPRFASTVTANQSWSPEHGIVFGGSKVTLPIRGKNSHGHDSAWIGSTHSTEKKAAGLTNIPAHRPKANSPTPSKASAPYIPLAVSALPLSYTQSPDRPQDQEYWHYKLYRSPQGERPRVHYCRSLETSERVAKMFLDNDLLGFDIEWKVNAMVRDGPRKNVCLIQIANESRIALFHLALFNKGDHPHDLVPPSFKLIMESPSITKVGVAIKADCTRLRTFLDVHSRSIFELSHLHKLVKYSATDARLINKRLVSLSQQMEEHFSMPMFKGSDVRESDWSRELSMPQIEYAASDSYAGLHLFDCLEAKRNALDPVPPRPAHADLNLPIRLASGAAVVATDEPQDAAVEADTVDCDNVVVNEESSASESEGSYCSNSSADEVATSDGPEPSVEEHRADESVASITASLASQGITARSRRVGGSGDDTEQSEDVNSIGRDDRGR